MRITDNCAKARKYAHEVFDPIWKYGGIYRSDAYVLLAEEMNLPEKDCHMSLMDEETASKVPAAVERIKIKLGLSKIVRWTTQPVMAEGECCDCKQVFEPRQLRLFKRPLAPQGEVNSFVRCKKCTLLWLPKDQKKRYERAHFHRPSAKG